MQLVSHLAPLSGAAVLSLLTLLRQLALLLYCVAQKAQERERNGQLQFTQFTQSTCFTGTSVQILTQNAINLLYWYKRADTDAERSQLALLVQACKY